LEVHPPDHALHSWRDFFVHMGTICLGLLIAIALEQSVEALHHHNELRELRVSLHEDDEKTLHDCDRIDAYIRASNSHSAALAAQVRNSFAHHQPLGIAPYQESGDWDLPGDPTWKAAKSSGLLALVPQNEIKLNSEINDIIDVFNAALPAYEDITRKVSRFETRLRLQSNSTAVSLDEMQTYLDLLAEKIDILNYLSLWSHQLRSATSAILHGETNLSVIQKAEQ